VPEPQQHGEKVRELTGGDGTHTALECIGLRPAIETAFAVMRDGGVVSRVGTPQYGQVPADFGVFLRNVTLTGGVAPARAGKYGKARRSHPPGTRVLDPARPGGSLGAALGTRPGLRLPCGIDLRLLARSSVSGGAWGVQAGSCRRFRR
jgi:hypothetical protein